MMIGSYIKKHQFKLYGILALVLMMLLILIRVLITGNFQIIDPENPLSNIVLFICRIIIYIYIYNISCKKLSNVKIKEIKIQSILIAIFGIYELFIVSYIPKMIYIMVGELL